MWKGFLAGLVVANGCEWVAHKYILHGTHRAGKPRYSPVPDSMKSHWEHHREVRKTDFHDQGYVEGISNWRTKNEIISSRPKIIAKVHTQVWKSVKPA